MQGKFEKNIEQQLSNFSLEPSPQIWQDVENVLHPHKKDRGLIWWWIPLLGLLLLGGGWWLFHSINQTKNNVPSIIIQYKKTTDSILVDETNKTNATAPSTIKIENSVDKKLNTAKKKTQIDLAETQAVKAVQPSRPVISNIKLIAAKSDVQSSTIINNNNSTVDVSEKNATEKQVTQPSTTTVPANVTTRITASETNQSQIIFTDTASIVHQKNNDSINAITEKRNTINELKDSAVTKKIIQPNKKVTQQHWWLTAGFGSLNITQSNLFAVSQNSQSYASSPNTISGGSTATGKIIAPQNGFNFFAGIAYEKSINKRWKLNTGLQYRYLQNKQYTGIDSVTASADHYYAAGDTTFKINNAYCLQLPLGLAYSLNPSAKNKFQLLFGAALDWTMHERWITTSTNNSRFPFHYDASLYNRFLLNLYAGIDYNCNNRFKVSLLVQQSITPIHKQTPEKYYWQQLNLQISKPLHASSHKKINQKNN